MIELVLGIDINKTSASKEFVIFQCWYFSDKRFTFQLNVMDVMMC